MLLLSFFVALDEMNGQSTNANFIVEWDNTIGSTGTEQAWSLVTVSSGGYLLCGFSSSGIGDDKTEPNIGATDYWIVKLNEQGVVEWQKTIGGTSQDNLTNAIETSDGGFLIGGTSNSDISGNKTENSVGNEDFWVVKTDSTGEIEWQNTIGGIGNDYLESICFADNGGYYLGGYSNSSLGGDKSEANLGPWDYWLVKINGSGAVIWDQTIGGAGSDHCFALASTIEGGCVLGGRSESNSSFDKTADNLGDWDY